MMIFETALKAPEAGAIRKLVSGEYDGKPLQIQIWDMEDPKAAENEGSDTLRVMIMDYEFSAKILITRQVALKLCNLPVGMKIHETVFKVTGATCERFPGMKMMKSTPG